jgi:hypothetical protein
VPTPRAFCNHLQTFAKSGMLDDIKSTEGVQEFIVLEKIVASVFG